VVKKLILMGALALVIVSCTMLNRNGRSEEIAKFHNLACSQPKKSNSPWNIGKLYDCASQEMFIPYQLWTGAKWDGDKEAPCMHTADILFNVNGVSATTIKGPIKWKNPKTDNIETIWSRDKVDGSKSQYFICHEKGIGRVYDSRGPRFFDRGRCKFPAGYGWKLLERRRCRDTSIEIISISLDENNNLLDLQFKWWTGSTLDHIYRYVPNKGMTHAWEQ